MNPCLKCESHKPLNVRIIFVIFEGKGPNPKFGPQHITEFSNKVELNFIQRGCKPRAIQTQQTTPQFFQAEHIQPSLLRQHHLTNSNNKISFHFISSQTTTTERNSNHMTAHNPYFQFKSLSTIQITRRAIGTKSYNLFEINYSAYRQVF